MLNKSLKYFVASVHNQKIPRINFQTKVTNVPWTFSNGLPQGTLFKQALSVKEGDCAKKCTGERPKEEV